VESKKYWWRSSKERASSERISRHSIGRFIEPDGTGNTELVSLGSSVVEGKFWKTAKESELGVGGNGATDARHSTTCLVVDRLFRFGRASWVKDGRARGNQQRCSNVKCCSMNWERVKSKEAEAPVSSCSLSTFNEGKDRRWRWENSSGISRCWWSISVILAIILQFGHVLVKRAYLRGDVKHGVWLQV